jgi:hypothetical protein
MMIKSLGISALFFLFTILILTACQGAKKNAVAQPGKDYAGLGYVQAKIIKYDVDGCKWLLQLDELHRLVPSAPLPSVFQQENILVWIKYTLKKGGAGFCMAGQIVELADIKHRK